MKEKNQNWATWAIKIKAALVTFYYQIVFTCKGLLILNYRQNELVMFCGFQLFILV